MPPRSQQGVSAEDQSELDDFDEVMSEEGLDSPQEDEHDSGDGADLSESSVDEDEALADDAGPEGQGAENGEAEGVLSEGSDGSRFEVPAEFGGSVEKWAAAQQEALDRANAKAGQSQEQALYLNQLLRDQALRQQAQAQGRQTQGTGQPSQDVLVAAALIGSESFTQLPEEIQRQAKEYVYRRRAVQEQFFGNPEAHIQQAAEALFQQRVAPLEARIRQMESVRFQEQHHEFLGTPEGRTEFVKASNMSQLDLVMENLKLKRALESAARSNKEQQRKDKDKKARRTAQRGSNRRPQQRAGRAQPRLTLEESANPMTVANRVLEEDGIV